MDSEEKKQELNEGSASAQNAASSTEMPGFQRGSLSSSEPVTPPAPVNGDYSTPAQASSPESTPTVTPSKESKPSVLRRITARIGSREPGTPNKVGRFLRKFWWLILIVVVLLAGLIGWRAYANHIDGEWKKASDYYGRADYSNAAKILNKMSVPRDSGRLQIYAQTMLATRQLDKALPAYKSLYDQKKDPAVKLIIGNIYNEQNKFDDAAKAYNELIAANAAYVQAYVNLSTLYKLQGKSDDAISVAKKGVAANPNSAVLYELLISMLLDKKDSSDYKQAVASLKKINPQDPIFKTIGE